MRDKGLQISEFIIFLIDMGITTNGGKQHGNEQWKTN